MSKVKILKRFAVISVLPTGSDRVVQPLATFKSKSKAQREIKLLLASNPTSDILLGIVPIYGNQGEKVKPAKAAKPEKVSKPSKLAVAAGLDYVTNDEVRAPKKSAAHA